MNVKQWDDAGKRWWNNKSIEQRRAMLLSPDVQETGNSSLQTPAGSPARCYEVFVKPPPKSR